MWFNVIASLLGAAAVAVGAWIPGRLKKPTDLERADLLAKIASAAAALALSMFPNAKWSELLNFVVQQIAAAAGLPTKNADAIKRAAVQALMERGKTPDAAAPR